MRALKKRFSRFALEYFSSTVAIELWASFNSCANFFDITNSLYGEGNIHYRGDNNFVRTATLEIVGSGGVCKGCNPAPNWDQVMKWSLDASGPYHRNDLTFDLVFGHTNQNCDDKVCDILHEYTGPLKIYVNNDGGGRGWLDIRLKSTYPAGTATINYTTHRVVVAYYIAC